MKEFIAFSIFWFISGLLGIIFKNYELGILIIIGSGLSFAISILADIKEMIKDMKKNLE
jgi:hypothetical protein